MAGFKITKKMVTMHMRLRDIRSASLQDFTTLPI